MTCLKALWLLQGEESYLVKIEHYVKLAYLSETLVQCLHKYCNSSNRKLNVRKYQNLTRNNIMDTFQHVKRNNMYIFFCIS